MKMRDRNAMRSGFDAVGAGLIFGAPRAADEAGPSCEGNVIKAFRAGCIGLGICFSGRRLSVPVEFLPVIGFLAGLLVISFGGGGGAIYVGVLTALCGVPPELAASTSLATIIPTTLVGALGHFRAGHVDLRLMGLLLASALVGTVFGTWVSAYIPEGIYYLISGALLLILSTQMLWTLVRQRGAPLRRPGERLSRKEFWEASAFGLLSGVMTGAIGLSGGGPITAALFLLRCPALRTVGTSVTVIAVMSTAGFLTHLAIGHIDWRLVGYLASGTIAGAIAAPPLLDRLGKERAERVIRPLIITVNYILGVLILMK